MRIEPAKNWPLPPVKEAIARATRLGQCLEDLVVSKGQFVIRSERDDLFIGYWSLIFEYAKGILCLLRADFPAPAFALQRPLAEALVKAHIALIGSKEDVEQIRKDRYNVSFEKDGGRIDGALRTAPVFHNYLTTAKKYLHSLTHSGKAQLLRRFDGADVGAAFKNEEIVELAGVTSAAVFLMTILIMRHFAYDRERQQAEQYYREYGATS
jgi:hypothetical protein